MTNSLFDLSGKVALVTGGNSGIGLGYATGMAKCGSDIILWGRSEEKNARAREHLSQFGVRVATAVVDVSDEQAVIAGMADAVNTFGRLDTVVANAGGSSMIPTIKMDSQSYHDLISISQHGGFYTLREAGKYMVERSKAGDRGGSLIVTGSLMVMVGVPGMAHYGAAKAALSSIMKTLAVELAPHGIRSNMIAPGYFHTELVGSSATDEAAKRDEMFAKRTPMGRSGRPSDLEGIAAYLASDASAYHTGDIFVIDGGWMANLF